ncbi:hypothetical protein [Pteropox virus]|uniref:Uncharacterized protein n=1 Tax=Pteropox virus TaxID=1873698 RepID=A0A1B1MRP6_9POXV|nr:hypothetical protein [Pteropox virus]ANS71225.1 hypothetical protein [Pteropox virus]
MDTKLFAVSVLVLWSFAFSEDYTIDSVKQSTCFSIGASDVTLRCLAKVKEHTSFDQMYWTACPTGNPKQCFFPEDECCSKVTKRIKNKKRTTTSYHHVLFSELTISNLAKSSEVYRCVYESNGGTWSRLINVTAVLSGMSPIMECESTREKVDEFWTHSTPYHVL